MNKINTLRESVRIQIPPSAPEPEARPAENSGAQNSCVRDCDQAKRLRQWSIRALKSARDRCHNPHNKDFAAYGGRGIRVCAEWSRTGGYRKFLRHIGAKPTSQHTLDRIDPNGDYEPGNVRWATMAGQSNNRRTSKLITWRGETLAAGEWARRIGIGRQQIANRINRGWDVERALTEPVRRSA